MNNAISGNNSAFSTSTAGGFPGYTLSNPNTINGQIASAKAIDNGSKLPIEVLVKIFIHCSLQDMGSLAQVNRLYRSAVYDALLGTLFLNKIRVENKREITKTLIEEEITETTIEQKVKKVAIEETATRIDVKQKIIQCFASEEFKHAFAGSLEFFKKHPTAHHVFQALLKNSRLDLFCEGDLFHAVKLLLNFDGRYVKRMPSSLIDMGICIQPPITSTSDSKVSTEDINLSAPFYKSQWRFIINEIPNFLTNPQKLNIKEFRKIPHQVLKEGIIKQATCQTDQWLKAFLNAGIRINHSDFHKCTPLMLRMIKNGFIDRFKLLLALGVDKDLYISGCGSFLNYALKIRSISIAEYLIKMGADLNILDKDGNAALHIAFYARDFSEIEIGAYFSILDESGNVVPPITFNSECPPDIVKLLVQNGANVNKRNAQEETLLQSLLNISNYAVALRWSGICCPNNIAADSGEAQHLAEALRMDLLKCLLEKQVNLEKKNKQGETALQMAFRAGCSPDVIKLLVENGADVNARNALEETLLQSVVGMSSYSEALRMDLLKFLLEKQVNLEAKNKQGETALQVAFRIGRSPDVIKLLVEKGANVNVRNAQEETLLQSVVGISSHSVALRWQGICCPNNIAADSGEAQYLAEALRMDLLKCLLKKQVNLEAKNKQGETALQMAFRVGRSSDVIKLLVEKGADVNVRNAREETLLQSVVGMNSYSEALRMDLLKFLLEKQVNLEAKNKQGETALQTAFRAGCSPDVIKLLVEKGADINVRNALEETLLQSVVGMNSYSEALRMDLLKFLLEKQVNLEAKNKQGETALQVAFRIGRSPDVIKLLVEKGANVNVCNAQEETLLQSLVGMSGSFVAAHWSGICRPNNIAANSSEAQYLAEALRMDLLKCLLKKQVNLEEKNKQGETALQTAFRAGCSPDAIKLLVEKGADVNVRNAQEETLLQSVVGMSSHSVASRWPGICCPNNIAVNSSEAQYLAEALRMDLLKCLLKKQVNLEEKNKQGETALQTAFRAGCSPDAIKLLVEKGADVNVRNAQEETLLQSVVGMSSHSVASRWPGICCPNNIAVNSSEAQYLAEALRMDLLKCLLKKQVNLEEKNKQGETALQTAFRAGCSPDVIKLLVEKGADVNVRNAFEETLLQSVVDINSYSEAPRIELLKCLLQKQVNLEEKNTQGETALQTAFRAGCSPDAIKLLIENGANVNVRNAQEETLLQSLVGMSGSFVATHWSSICRPNNIAANSSEAQYLAEVLRMDLLKCLLKKHVNLEEKNKQGETALQTAFRAGCSPDVIKLLVEKGANINVRNAQQKTLLQSVVGMYSYSEAIRMNLLKCLLEKQVNLEEKNKQGETALQTAFRVGCAPDAIKLLIEKGANINVRNAQEETLLQSVVGMSSHSVALRWPGICCPNNIAANSSEAQYLAEALRMNLLKFLLEKQVNLEAKNKQGETALQMAFRVGRSPDVIKLLVEKGANINVRDAQQKNLLQSLLNMTSYSVALRWPNICCPENISANSSEAQYLAEAFRMNLLTCLLEYGALPSGVDAKENRALPFAFRTKFSLDIWCRLLQKGANPDVRDREGKTLLQVLMEMDHAQMDLHWRNSCPLIDQIREMSTSEAKAALEKFRRNLVMWLLTNGADPNSTDQDGNTILHTALNEGAPLELMQLLLQKGANPNIKDPDGNTILDIAFNQRSSLKLIHLLLHSGADPDIKNAKGKTVPQALMEMRSFQIAWDWRDSFPPLSKAWKVNESRVKNAAEAFRTNLMKCLLKSVDVNRAGADTNIALQAGPQSTSPFENIVIKLLLTENANATNEARRTPLHMAFSRGFSFEVIQWLLQNGEDPNIRNAEGKTLLQALMELEDSEIASRWGEHFSLIGAASDKGELGAQLAAEGFRIALMRCLLEKGADPNIVNAALQTALKRKYSFEVIKCLLNHKADPNSTDQDGNTALDIAFNQRSSLKLIHLLLHSGADPEIKNAKGKTVPQALIEMHSFQIAWGWRDSFPPLSKAWKVNESRVKNAAEAFRTNLMKCLSRSVDVNRADADANIALQTGSQYTFPSEDFAIKHLLTANANAEDEERSTPLHMAFSKGFSFEVIQGLLQNGEDPNIKNAQGKTLLQALMELEDSEIASRWGEHFSLIGAASDKGELGAQLAAEGFRIALMECVLEKGADPDIVNAALQTALKRKYSFAVIECLLNHKADPNEKDQDNNAALHIALNEGAPLDVIRLLLRKDANLETENAHRKTPLQTLMGMDDAQIASRWRDSCRLIGVAWGNGEPEALLAARKFRIDLMECLLQGGANPVQAMQNRTVWRVLLDYSALFKREIVVHFKTHFQVENFNPLCNEEDLQLLKLAKNHQNEELTVFLGSKMENTWEREIKVHYFRSFCIYLNRLWKRFRVWRLGGL